LSLLEAFRLALDTIRVQKLKSFFTLLGVMIGVMFLVAVFSIVQGMSDYVENDFAGKLFGVNTFTLRRRPAILHNVSDDQWREFQRRPRIYQPEVDLVKSALPPGSRWAVTSQSTLYASSQYNRPRQVQAVATESEFFTIKKYNITSGRAFVPQEVAAGAKVMVIGVDVASHFFPGLDPVGRELRIRGTPYTVVGVMEKQGNVFGFSLDRFAIAPYTTPLSRAIHPRGDFDGLQVQEPSDATLRDAIETAREVLRGARRLQPGRPDNFALDTEDSALTFFGQLKQRLLIFGAALPAIGLLVGALVIMNIMLVAVAERTREIGIRKALGATRSDILTQFLIEAATLSVFGAAIGITLGIIAAKVVAATTPLPASVAPWSIAVGLVLGAGVGVVAGVYPASRAALLDPIAALRQE
jgi:putative ABC transport system permease protein